MTQRRFVLTALALVAGAAWWLASIELPARAEQPAAKTTGSDSKPATNDGKKTTVKNIKIVKSEAEWRKQLTPEQFRICRQKGTERPFTGAYHDEHRQGTYHCVACGQELFISDAKFDSGTGWPSFWAPIAKQVVDVHIDRSHGMVREEVTCSRCGSHLGHVFDDGPKPTGLRYCMNSASLKFEPGDTKTATTQEK